MYFRAVKIVYMRCCMWTTVDSRHIYIARIFTLCTNTAHEHGCMQSFAAAKTAYYFCFGLWKFDMLHFATDLLVSWSVLLRKRGLPVHQILADLYGTWIL